MRYFNTIKVFSIIQHVQHVHTWSCRSCTSRDNNPLKCTYIPSFLPTYLRNDCPTFVFTLNEHYCLVWLLACHGYPTYQPNGWPWTKNTSMSIVTQSSRRRWWWWWWWLVPTYVDMCICSKSAIVELILCSPGHTGLYIDRIMNQKVFDFAARGNLTKK